MQRETTPAQLVDLLYAELLAGNDAIIDEIVSPEYFSHTEANEVDRASLKASCREFFQPLRDLRREVLLAMNDGARGMVLHRYVGFVTATGQPISIRSADIYEVRAGLLCEHWGVYKYEEP
jgi:predicted SnoaL-like aldol condensation-catalyzing enzyme